MVDLINRDQVILFQQFLFGRTLATVPQPQPSIAWVGGDIAQIRQQWRAAPTVEVPALPPDGFQNTFADLVQV